jgi:hypothetical protein
VSREEKSNKLKYVGWRERERKKSEKSKSIIINEI